MTQQPENEPEPKDPPDTSWVTEIDVREGDKTIQDIKDEIVRQPRDATEE